MKRNTGCLASLWVAIVSISACSWSGPPPTTYVLGDTATTGFGAVSQVAAPVVELKPVRVPDFLDTTDVFTLRDGGQIVASQGARWGERLSVGVTRAVATSLAEQLPQVVVTTSPPLESPRWQVFIDIDTFEVQPGGQSVLVGRWRIWQSRGEKKLADERISLGLPVGKGTDAEVVAAMTQQVNQLAGRIALALESNVERHRLSNR